MMATVVPGPYRNGTSPAPTEIACIWVENVYASCTQTITATTTVCDRDVPPDCLPCDRAPGAFACTVNFSASTCRVGAIVPSGTDSINNITYTLTAVVDVTCVHGVTTVPIAIYTTTTAPLYNPAGTIPACTMLSGTCSAVLLPNGPLSVQVTLCLLLQTVATVQLLVPSFGYCVPTPCAVAAIGVCPPSNLFSPQA